MRLAAGLVVVLAALVPALLVNGLAPPTPAGYVHSDTDRVHERGRWVTVCRVPMPRKGWVHVGAQVPIRVRSGGTPTWVHLRFVREPAMDGTGDLRAAVSRRTWTLTHWHTIRGFRGHIAVRVLVPGNGRWLNPWRVCKAVRT